MYILYCYCWVVQQCDIDILFCFLYIHHLPNLIICATFWLIVASVFVVCSYISVHSIPLLLCLDIAWIQSEVRIRIQWLIVVFFLSWPTSIVGHILLLIDLIQYCCSYVMSLAHEYASKRSDYCWCHLFDAYMCHCWHTYEYIWWCIAVCGVGINWRLSLRLEWWTVDVPSTTTVSGRMQKLQVMYKHWTMKAGVRS